MPTLSIGQFIQGSFSFDPLAVQTGSGFGTSVTIAHYQGPDTGLSINFDVGGYTASASVGDVGLSQNPRYSVWANTLSAGFDRFQITSEISNSTLVGGVSASDFQLQLTDESDAVFATTAPLTSLDLADFDTTTLTSNFDGIIVTFDNGSQLRASMEIMTLDSGTVPEPGALLIFVVGVVGTLAVRRRPRAA